MPQLQRRRFRFTLLALAAAGCGYDLTGSGYQPWFEQHDARLGWELFPTLTSQDAQGAAARCRALTTSGLSWRLPTAEELKLLHAEREDFPNVSLDEGIFWGGSPEGATTLVSFLDGSAKNAEGVARVRCVTQLPETWFVQQGTELQWRREPALDLVWDDAVEYCEELPGRRKWRLPTKAELLSLKSSRGAYPYPGMNADRWYWASDSAYDHELGEATKAQVNFQLGSTRGEVTGGDPEYGNDVRCVR